MNLTDKQKRFCEEYIIDCNATQAAIRAGYSEKTAYSQGQRLLKNVEINGYVEKLLEELKENSLASADEVLQYLTSVMRGEHKEQVLRWVGDGCQKIDLMNVSEKDRIRACELLGKRFGLFKDSVDVNGVAQVVFVDDLEE